ncbi:ABC transporter ATP-binding protein [Mediterraneibacter gnavus]|jgi:ATP-binding cassette subfamily B multidrug efflux pump|uniref:ABC transporter ATP-binding protein n=1 Tax=Mediterraneibacter gnavus TaxID=33038 RepID=UPI0036D2C8DA
MNRKPKVSKENLQTAKRLLKYVTGTYKVRFVIVFICILLSSIASISVSLSLKFLIDDFISPLIGQKDPNFAELYRALAVLGSIFLMGVIATFTYTRLMVYIGQGVLKKVRDDMFEHMQTLPIRYFDQNTNGSIMSLYTNDTDTLRQMISQSIPQALMSFFTIVVTFISMLILSPLLTILAVLIIGLMIFVTKKIGGNSGKYFVRQQKSLADVTGFVEERMNGQRVVKVFNHERKSEEEFDKLNEALFESAAQANTFANMMGPVIGNIGNLQFVLVSVLGGFLSIMGSGGITLGVMASYLQFTKSFTQPFMQVAQQFNSIVMALAGAERIFALIDEESEKDEGYVTLVNAKKDENGNIIECKERTGMWAWKHPHSADGSVSYTELTGDVRFEDVTFGYNEDKVILKDISLFAKPGQKLAFVGSTGAGKTTITNLINRFYDIQEGKIRYDGINITKIKKDDLRRSLGIVLQDTHLFTGTIMDNIRYGKLDATDEEVYEAAKLAHADQFIKMLPKGYDTMLSGDGEELSQGQRQLLSIARAAVANPPVLILDEATSSIDTRTESIVQKGMDNLMKGRTVFVIAHRLSTIRNSDAIIVLEHGKIIERGDHADLIKMKGTYYQLYTGKLELS